MSSTVVTTSQLVLHDIISEKLLDYRPGDLTTLSFAGSMSMQIGIWLLNQQSHSEMNFDRNICGIASGCVWTHLFANTLKLYKTCFIFASY